MANNVIKVVGGLGAASVIAVSGAALASSQTSPSTSSSTTKSAQQGDHHGGMRHGTPVTGATLTSVTNAVKAKDSAVTVKVVFKDADGSYDALGTKAGKPVHVDVSKDLKTVTVKTGFAGRGGPGGPGGHGMHRGTAVSGTELTNVKTAVKAKDSAVTVERVFKESDGTYHAMGTKAGQRVHVEVSKDLKTVTVKTGGPGGHAPQAPSGSSSASASPTA